MNEYNDNPKNKYKLIISILVAIILLLAIIIVIFVTLLKGTFFIKKVVEETTYVTTKEITEEEATEETIEKTTEKEVEEKNTAPKAIISPYELIAGINQEISISGKNSSDLENDELTYEWTLPDGSVSTEPSITLSFDEFGEYEISLTVHDGEFSDTAKKIIYIENQPPVTKVNKKNIYCEVGEVIFLTAEDSYDPDGDELTYSWELPDGTFKEQMKIEYKTNEPGEQKIVLTVSDGELESHSSIKIEISETPEYFKASCINVSYDELLRYPEKYEGVRIHVKGEIMQDIYLGYLIQITKGSYGIWDDITHLLWFKDEPKIIEDDIIEIWGYGDGLYSYTTVMGAEKTVPSIDGEYVELLIKAGSR